MRASKDVDALVSAATRNQGKDALGAAIRALDESEVFYRATVESTKDGQRVTTPLVRLSDGSHALVVYTSKSHPDLPTKFGGAPWHHVLNMAASLSQADWLIVSTTTGEWLPITKAQISVMNGLEKSRNRESQDSVASTVAGDNGIERLISEAKASPSSSWSEPLIDSLRGRELFVRISPERSPDGRPVMISSEVDEMRGLVQAYTSRVRQGFTYGGMTWEAIVSLVKNASEIPGVHIINENNDWVVLGRSEI